MDVVVIVAATVAALIEAVSVVAHLALPVADLPAHVVPAITLLARMIAVSATTTAATLVTALVPQTAGECLCRVKVSWRIVLTRN